MDSDEGIAGEGKRKLHRVYHINAHMLLQSSLPPSSPAASSRSRGFEHAAVERLHSGLMARGECILGKATGQAGFA